VWGMCSAFITELWEVFERLRCARKFGFTRIGVHVDLAAVVKILNSGACGTPCGRLVINIRRLLDMDWDNTGNKLNPCADTLFNLGVL